MQTSRKLPAYTFPKASTGFGSLYQAHPDTVKGFEVKRWFLPGATGQSFQFLLEISLGLEMRDTVLGYVYR